MKIVIDIPEPIYKSAFTDLWQGSPTVGNAIRNGTPFFCDTITEKIKNKLLEKLERTKPNFGENCSKDRYRYIQYISCVNAVKEFFEENKGGKLF